MDRTGRASRALIGSLIVNGAIVALLFAVAPRRFDRRLTAPLLLDVAIEPLKPPPPPPPPPPVVAPVVAPVTHHAPARAPAILPTTVTPWPDDLAAGGDRDGSGNGSAGGDGGSGAVVSVPAPPGPAATMPIPLGSRSAQLPYTREALVAHTQGNVLVRVLVGADGKVHQAALVRGLGHGLDAIALGLAGKLAFEPARDALGAPTVAQITWRFHFTPPL